MLPTTTSALASRALRIVLAAIVTAELACASDRLETRDVALLASGVSATAPPSQPHRMAAAAGRAAPMAASAATTGTSATAAAVATAASSPIAGRTVAIVGASVGGLAAANVLHQYGARVTVFERAAHTFEAKGSGLGYCDTRLWEELRGARMIRRGQRAHRRQGAFYYGDLWRFLRSGLPGSTSTRSDGGDTTKATSSASGGGDAGGPGTPSTGATLRLGHSVTAEELGDDPAKPTIDSRVYDLVVIADGGFSGLRRLLTSSEPQYAGYAVWRGMVDASAVPGFDAFGVWKNGVFDTIAMPLVKDRSSSDSIVFGVFIEAPEAEMVALQGRPRAGAARHDTDSDAAAGRAFEAPDWFLPLYRKQFGGHAGGELVRLMEAAVASGVLRCHPQYEYAADVVARGRLVMVGDAAHMASPRTAVGAHTAVLDAMGLREAFAPVPGGASSALNIDRALERYAAGGLERARALYRRSREVSAEFVHGGGVEPVSPALLVGAARETSGAGAGAGAGADARDVDTAAVAKFPE